MARVPTRYRKFKPMGWFELFIALIGILVLFLIVFGVTAWL